MSVGSGGPILTSTVVLKSSGPQIFRYLGSDTLHDSVQIGLYALMNTSMPHQLLNSNIHLGQLSCLCSSYVFLVFSKHAVSPRHLPNGGQGVEDTAPDSGSSEPGRRVRLTNESLQCGINVVVESSLFSVFILKLLFMFAPCNIFFFFF